MAALNRSKWDYAEPAKTHRVRGYTKAGNTGDHVKPTAYITVGGTCNPLFTTPSGSPYSLYDIPNEQPYYNLSGTIPQSLINQSWERLISKMRDGPASLGESIAQSGQAFEMIANRFGTLYHGFMALRKGRFREFLRALRIDPKKRHRNKVVGYGSELGDLWLEYYFGWAPLLSDVYESAHVLTKSPPEGQSFRGSASSQYLLKVNAAVVKLWGGRQTMVQGGKFHITNPNLFLLQQVGLANPALLAWNLVPFSFLVDWVFDVGSFIGGYSDLLGVSVKDPYRSYYRRAQCTAVLSGVPKTKQSCAMYCMQRWTSLSKPSINFDITKNLGTSWKRAATAASLLGQALARGFN